jgi:hypothetical protein
VRRLCPAFNLCPGLRLRVRALVLVVVATLIVAGCSLHSIGVGVSNSSGQDFYVRLHYDYGEIHVLKAPAHKNVDVLWFGEVGELQATIELLRPDCSVVGSWRNASGGSITIDAAGSASFGPISEQEVAYRRLTELQSAGRPPFGHGVAFRAHLSEVCGRPPCTRGRPR